MAKRPKVDVHHFNLLDKLREANLEPKPFLQVTDHEVKLGTKKAAKASPSITVPSSNSMGQASLPEALVDFGVPLVITMSDAV